MAYFKQPYDPREVEFSDEEIDRLNEELYNQNENKGMEKILRIKRTIKWKQKIRTLRAEEIECRVQSVTPKGCILLIYKDARVDMKILDEVYGNNNWQRTHEVINENLFCNIDIWDNEKKIMGSQTRCRNGE